MSDQNKPLNCTIEEKQGQPLTVAESFVVHCLGSVPENIKMPLLVIDPPQSKGQTHVLRIQDIISKSTSNLDLRAVSYRPGNHVDLLIKVTDGENEIELSGLSYSVNSILKPNEQAQMEPSVGPFVLGFPIAFYLALIGMIIVTSVLLMFVYGRRKVKKKREQEMKLLFVPEDCGKVFHRECRKLSKETDMNKRLSGLELEVRHYLVRRLFVPAHLAHLNVAFDAIRKNHKFVHEHCGVLLRKIEAEFKKAKGKTLTAEDMDQLMREARHLIDEIEKWYQHQGANK